MVYLMYHSGAETQCFGLSLNPSQGINATMLFLKDVGLRNVKLMTDHYFGREVVTGGDSSRD